MMRQLFKPETMEHPGFAAFWSAYPRCPHKVAKGAARQVWNQIQPDEALQARILQSLDEQKRCKGWLEAEGQYIPKPENWLRDERWDDEIGTVKKEQGVCRVHHQMASVFIMVDGKKVWKCKACG
jgi:hypothetical protein